MTDLDRVYERLLVLRCQTGDAAAFTEIVERYHKRLRVFLAGMLPSSDAVDDALQDVWFDAWRSVGRLEDQAAFTGWLFAIARNRAYRVLRHGRILAPMQPIEAVDLPAEPTVETDLQIDADERRLLATSLERLPHEQREVLLLRFVEQLSYDQIARAIGRDLGTVRSRIHYAKRALRRLYLERTSP